VFHVTNLLLDIDHLSLKACRRRLQIPGLNAQVEFAALRAK
jgi:hypothetical protein